MKHTGTAIVKKLKKTGGRIKQTRLKTPLKVYLKNQWTIYLLILPSFLYLLIFNYLIRSSPNHFFEISEVVPSALHSSRALFIASISA